MQTGSCGCLSGRRRTRAVSQKGASDGLRSLSIRVNYLEMSNWPETKWHMACKSTELSGVFPSVFFFFLFVSYVSSFLSFLLFSHRRSTPQHTQRVSLCLLLSTDYTSQQKTLSIRDPHDQYSVTPHTLLSSHTTVAVPHPHFFGY